MKNQYGFALIELIPTIGIVFSTFATAFTLLYASYTHLWIDHITYQCALCLSSQAGARYCRSQAVAQGKSLLITQTIDSVQPIIYPIPRSFKRYSCTTYWQLPLFKNRYFSHHHINEKRWN